MVCMQIYRPASARAQLIGIGKGIFQHLHHRHHAAGLVFNQFDRRTGLTQVVSRNATPPPRLRVAGPSSHCVRWIPYCLQYAAGSRRQTPRAAFAAVEEGQGGGLETSADDFLQQMLCQLYLSRASVSATIQTRSSKPLQIALAVKSFQGIAGVIFQGTEEGRKAEFLLYASRNRF